MFGKKNESKTVTFRDKIAAIRRRGEELDVRYSVVRGHMGNVLSDASAEIDRSLKEIDKIYQDINVVAGVSVRAGQIAREIQSELGEVNNGG